MSYCSWDQSSELNIKYHDTEWGVPLHDERGQFEFLMMEVKQESLLRRLPEFLWINVPVFSIVF